MTLRQHDEERPYDNTAGVDAATPPAELTRLLIERGAEPAMAEALVSWLGVGARILIEKS